MRQTISVALLCMLMSPSWSRPSRVTYTRVHKLDAEEGVLAYARISPHGQYLAYSSELEVPGGNGALTHTVRVVDLDSKRVVFAEPGVDPYWSNDGRRMIFLSKVSTDGTVTVRHHLSGLLSRNVAPVSLGDYFSWGLRDGRDVILTADGNYYFLAGDHAVPPAARIARCPDIGSVTRPLISKDGQRVSAFVDGAVVVRNLTDCREVFNTGIQGGKADFSWDGRYLALHAARKKVPGYDIVIVDLERATMRRLTELPGSSLFPSWTKDGRICFRYDSHDYRGFVIATDILTAAEEPLPEHLPSVRRSLQWVDVFPETPLPMNRLTIVLIWAPWSAHSGEALAALQRVRDDLRNSKDALGAIIATDTVSAAIDVSRVIRRHSIVLQQIPLPAARLHLTGAVNKIPTALLFQNGTLVDQRLGAQSYEALRSWLADVMSDHTVID